MSCDGYSSEYYVAKNKDGEYLHHCGYQGGYPSGPEWWWGGLMDATRIDPEYFSEENNPYKRGWSDCDLDNAELVLVKKVVEIWEVGDE